MLASATEPRLNHCGQLAPSCRSAAEIGVRPSVVEPTRMSAARDESRSVNRAPGPRAELPGTDPFRPRSLPLPLPGGGGEAPLDLSGAEPGQLDDLAPRAVPQNERPRLGRQRESLCEQSDDRLIRAPSFRRS